MDALFGFTGPADLAQRERMSEELTHRGRRSVLVHEDGPCTLGLRTELDEPMRGRVGSGVFHQGSQHDSQAIVLSGFLTHRDAVPTLADLLDWYRSEGISFVERLRGAFVLAISDGPRLHLARDAAGERTVYYAAHRGRLIFASEPKAVVAASGFSRRLRAAAVAQYLTFSFVPEEGTMLEGVYELRPGHVLTFDSQESTGALRQHRVFHFEDPTTNGDIPETEWVSKFRSVFQQAVSERLPCQEPVGVFLSGGLDSSVVAAEVARQHRHVVKTYSIHFGKRYPHELEFAGAVARRWRTEHEEVFVRPKDFLPRLRQIVWHLDDPIGDPITVPNFELAKHVSRDVRWVFNGEGGDPCFGGPKNIPLLLTHWYGGLNRPATFREKAYLESYRRCYDDLNQLLTPDFLSQLDFEADLENVVKPFFAAPRPVRFLDKLAAINIRLKGAHLILPKVERMAGAWGLAPLAPLFDEDVLRFSFEMPASLRLHRGIEKVVLKRAYVDDLPPEVIARPKSGMRVPVHYWFRKEMRRYARSILHPREVRRVGIFNPERVRQLLDYNIENSPGRYGLRLWMLVTFEIWRRIVLEGESV